MSASGLRLDLHNHTAFSGDGLLSPLVLLRTAKSRGVDCLAVTDHNTVRGGLEALTLSEGDLSLPRVIPGTELLTREGEIVGLYVQREIPAGLSLVEAVERIRRQGGLAYLPHPYDVFRRGSICPRERVHAAQLADIVEVVNGRSLGPWPSRKAAALARDVGRPRGAGSDAHCAHEVGMAYVIVDEMPTRETLVDLLWRGRVEHQLNSREYCLNWGLQCLSPITRARRSLSGEWRRR